MNAYPEGTQRLGDAVVDRLDALEDALEDAIQDIRRAAGTTTSSIAT